MDPAHNKHIFKIRGSLFSRNIQGRERGKSPQLVRISHVKREPAENHHLFSANLARLVRKEVVPFEVLGFQELGEVELVDLVEADDVGLEGREGGVGDVAPAGLVFGDELEEF